MTLKEYIKTITDLLFLYDLPPNKLDNLKYVWPDPFKLHELIYQKKTHNKINQELPSLLDKKLTFLSKPMGKLNYSNKEELFFMSNNIFVKYLQQDVYAIELIEKWDLPSRYEYKSLKDIKEKTNYLESLDLKQVELILLDY